MGGGAKVSASSIWLAVSWWGIVIEISRITTVYDEVEDRVSLTGQGPADEIYRGWLTRRLFDILLERLFEILGAADADGYSSVINEFAQNSAEADLKPSPPVTPGAGDQEIGPFLITEIDIADLDGTIKLGFRHNAEEGASLALAHRDLRKWLAIVRNAYTKAGWPMRNWPDWMTDRPSASAERPVLH